MGDTSNVHVTRPDIKRRAHSSATHYMFMLGDPHAMDVLFMETISSPACDSSGNCYEKVKKKQVFRVKKLVGRRGAPELELLAVVIVLFAPILHESLTNSNFAMLSINITMFKDVCKRVSFVG